MSERLGEKIPCVNLPTRYVLSDFYIVILIFFAKRIP